MRTAEQNYRLLQEIEANRRFLLIAYRQNPQLLERAEVRIRELLEVSMQQGHDDLKTAGMSKQRGISLIELIMFIVIVSVALAGILLVMNVTTRGSADPLIHKQALAIAESMLEEIELMPFTFCDPDDPTASTATAPAVGAGACTVQMENLGAEAAFAPYQTAAETRYSASAPYDNVNDYNGFIMAAGALLDISGAPVGPAGYGVAVAVANNVMPAVGASPAIAGSEALLIAVTVTGPDNVPVVVEGIRTRYSPTAVP